MAMLTRDMNNRILTTFMIERTAREDLKAISFFFPLVKGLLTSTSNVL